jgi:amino acid transporter
VWPAVSSLPALFCLGFLLPAYTITGFDASAHTAEETVSAATNVPRGIVRSVVVSGVSGWILLAAIVLGARDLDEAARQGASAFQWILRDRYPGAVGSVLAAGIVIAQYLCGLATVTSTSRMAFAFARDGGLPYSEKLRHVSPRFRSPSVAIWTVSAAAVGFMLYTPVYETVAAASTLFLYVSYVLPTALGLRAYGRTWRKMGPWTLGSLYRPLAAISIAGCVGLFLIAAQPPNGKSVVLVGLAAVLLAVVWLAGERRRFRGPPAEIYRQL